MLRLALGGGRLARQLTVGVTNLPAANLLCPRRLPVCPQLPLLSNISDYCKAVPSKFATTISKTVSSIKCTNCQLLQRLEFHSTSRMEKAPSRKVKKKLQPKPIRISKTKSMKASWEQVVIRPGMTVKDLAITMNRDIDHVFEVMLYVKGTDSYDQPHSVIDNFHIIQEIVDKSGFRWRIEAKSKTVEKTNKDVLKRPPAESSKLVKRPPVVTIMGHVDHGKTTLLDALRKSNVAAREFGGITQHIGAFSVKLVSGDRITFLDTPGHAAFSAMRARGANITDIVVLVVAADDGVMRQTVESIRYAQEAQVPIILAVSKMDKPQANPDMVMQGLLQHGIQLEGHGGDVQAVHISALKGANLPELQEAILTLAEVMEVRADGTGLVEATVIESSSDTARGKLSTAIVQRGTLKKGACLVAGTAWAKVRGLFNDQGQPIHEAPPGMPVEIIGWKELPSAGEEILEVESERRAKEVVEWRLCELSEKKMVGEQEAIRKKVVEHQAVYQQQRQERLGRGQRFSLRHRQVSEKVADEPSPGLDIIVKGDVAGSVEAILDVMSTYQSRQCPLRIMYSGVGDVTEQDVEMAASFNGIVYAFNVQCPGKVVQQAQDAEVPIKYHNIIYRMVDDLRDQLTQRLPLVEEEEILGEADVHKLFMINEGKQKVPVAGCRCIKGSLQKKHLFRLVRDGETIFDGELSSLKHFKSEVPTIKINTECGLRFADKTAMPQTGDVVICYAVKQVTQTLDWELDF